MALGTGTLGTAPLGTPGTAAVGDASGSSHVRGVGESVVVTLQTGGFTAAPVVFGTPRLVQHSAPPKNAERLACYLLPRHQREAILGDLEEDYRANFVPKYGERVARRMYWSQFFRSVAAMVPAGLWAAILGALGWLWSRLGG